MSSTAAQALAALLDGREYRQMKLSASELASAKADALVVVTGYSDDGVSFYGAIDDEAGAGSGTLVYLTGKGLLTSECCGDCRYFEKIRAHAATIQTHWDQDGYSWTYTTAIPHASFDVIDDGQKYCRGMVFALSDVQPAAPLI